QPFDERGEAVGGPCEKQHPRIAAHQNQCGRCTDRSGGAGDDDNRVQAGHGPSVAAYRPAQQGPIPPGMVSKRDYCGSVSPLISAHRGSCGVAGLPAAERYDRAIALGVDYVELDVRRTADRMLVNYHDDFTPSRHPTSSLTYAELKAELGAELLTLAELLDLVAGRVGLHVDLKEPGDEGEIVRTLLAHRAGGQFVVTSGEVVSIRAVKDLFPEVQAGLTLGTDLRDMHAWATMTERLAELFPGDRLKRSRADFVAAHQQLARIRLLRYCKRKRLPVWVWTVDEDSEIARFMADPRVTTLVTNRPDVALRLRAATTI
ncbi:MAG: glycerophosphoryl diester phosphodiesterase, partial [Chloroflexota bacterium]|nr:glycerophosphoryl diester phosphodiesterase [Chloroflexota bacterium]